MQPKVLFLNSVIGALGVITCIQAVPIEVVYSGDTCDCPKKLNYEMNMPIPPIPIPNIPSEHGYKVECPMKAKAHITYSFDFDVEKPVPKLPLPEPKLNIFAKVDRMTAHKKDCYETQEVPRTCSCTRCALGRRYVLPESSAARLTPNLRHPNSLDNTEPSSKMPPTTQIMAIFFKPMKQPLWSSSKTRNKRDISRIFMRPRKNEKRSDRVVKQYNKRLADIAASERTFFEDTQKPLRSRAITTASNGLRPLQQLSSFLALPNLRNKRDIKGEYDLIEKEREQMDLTLPEIIQFMPETLDPNFKRNQCNFGQSCLHSQVTESTSTPIITTTTMTTTAPSETTFTAVTTESEDVTTPQALNVTEANSLKHEGKEEKQTDNDVSPTHKKRYALNYMEGGCPIVIDAYNPTPNPGFTYEPLTDFETLPRPFNTANTPYGLDPIPQQYVGAPYNAYASTIGNDEPILSAPYAKHTIQQLSNGQLDQIISAIIHKHADFLESSTNPNKPLEDSSEEQELEAKYFLKSLVAGPWSDWSWFDENQQQHYHQHNHQHHPTVHYHTQHYHGPDTAYELPFSI